MPISADNIGGPIISDIPSNDLIWITAQGTQLALFVVVDRNKL